MLSSSFARGLVKSACYGLILALLAPSADGLELAMGLAAVEQGDDRQRPAYVFELGLADYQARLFLYGQTYGPVQETSSLVHVTRSFPLPFYSSLDANVGIAAINEMTKVSYSDPSLANYAQRDSALNVGMTLGLSSALVQQRSFYLRFAWESSIFPAGVVGGLFLVSGRKQLLYLTMGSNFL